MTKDIKEKLLEKYKHFNESFLCSIEDFFNDIKEIYFSNSSYQACNVLEQLLLPNRIISFKVVWEDDAHELQINQAWRVQHSNVLGAYKGGLRFHPSVNESILRRLAFEQTLKGALTNMSIGGAKGGSDFNPKGKSKNEIKRFCQAFMDELYRHIGDKIDVPAGDIGVGAHEIAYLYSRFLKITQEFTGVLTGKFPSFGGSCGRKEATGHGAIYFIEEVLKSQNQSLKGLRILISGAGNVAIYAAEKAIQHHAKVLTLSDTSGVIFFKEGLTQEFLSSIINYKNEKKSLANWYEDNISANDIEFNADETPWKIKADIALPCTKEDEINFQAASHIVKNKVAIIAEGSNLPLTYDASELIKKNKIIHLIGNMVNSGGIAVSHFERTQNATHQSWSCEKVDCELKKYMADLEKNIKKQAIELNDKLNYRKAANCLAFNRLAEATLYQ